MNTDDAKKYTKRGSYNSKTKRGEDIKVTIHPTISISTVNRLHIYAENHKIAIGVAIERLLEKSEAYSEIE